jgi:hypothetical protein
VLTRVMDAAEAAGRTTAALLARGIDGDRRRPTDEVGGSWYARQRRRQNGEGYLVISLSTHPTLPKRWKSKKNEGGYKLGLELSFISFTLYYLLNYLFTLV